MPDQPPSLILGRPPAFLSVLLWPVLLSACRLEERLVFHPVARISRTPQDIGLSFDDVYFVTRDGVRLNGWFVPHREAKATLLWFHGNAGNISHRLENIRLLHERVKVNIFIFDYRGYGRSEGTVAEDGTYLDGEAAIEYLRSRYGMETKSLILFGRSLGAAVAAEMATRFDNMGVILESPFTSVREMARAMFPFLPVGNFLRIKYDIVEKVRKIRRPLLVLHGDRDEIVPFTQGKMVFAAASHPKKFYTILGAGHNDTYIVGGNPYFQVLEEFIEGASLDRQ